MCYPFYIVTNTRPHQLFITKVKQFDGSSSFTRRSQWTVEQLRQVNGINPNKVGRIQAFSSHQQWSDKMSHEMSVCFPGQPRVRPGVWQHRGPVGGQLLGREMHLCPDPLPRLPGVLGRESRPSGKNWEAEHRKPTGKSESEC